MDIDLDLARPRFWANTATSAHGCWEWLLAASPSGYGQLSVKSKVIRAHRLSYLLNKGPIPDDMVVMHLCDNRICVNPDHLQLGSKADNIADCRAKGRWTNKKKPVRPKGVDGRTLRKTLPSERLWDKVEIAGPEDCWPFTGKHAPDGYGRISVGRNRWVGAHRIAFSIENGPIPYGLVVMHTCDNPPCCNPAHLVVGTRGDNNRDRAAKRRGREHRQHGEANANVKIKDADLPRIFELREQGWSQQRIADEFGVKQPQISRILLGVQRKL